MFAAFNMKKVASVDNRCNNHTIRSSTRSGIGIIKSKSNNGKAAARKAAMPKQNTKPIRIEPTNKAVRRDRLSFELKSDMCREDQNNPIASGKTRRPAAKQYLRLSNTRERSL